jgi:hypothetical protein
MNKVMLVGRLTRDPELRSLPSGKHVATCWVATGTPQSGRSPVSVTFGHDDQTRHFHVAVHGGRGGPRGVRQSEPSFSRQRHRITRRVVLAARVWRRVAYAIRVARRGRWYAAI